MLLWVNPAAANTEQAQDLAKYFGLSFSSFLILEHPGRPLYSEENRSGATSNAFGFWLWITKHFYVSRVRSFLAQQDWSLKIHLLAYS